MFQKYDLYPSRAATLNEIIKKAPTAKEAYARYAKRNNVGCVNKQVRAALGADLWYREDFYEFLVSVGYEKERALFFTELVYGGEYKSYSKAQKNENLSRYSQDLHDFARAVVLPCRELLFREFSYEYALFSRMKEKRFINGIPDKSERIRMNILRMIDNDKLRERLNEERHVFGSDEAAVIAQNCSRLTLEEKHGEWKSIMENMPDTAINQRFPSPVGIAGVRDLLTEMIAEEDGFIANFRRETPGSVYTVESLKITQNGKSSVQSELIGVFASLPRFFEAYRSMSEPSELTAGFLLKRFPLDIPQKYESVYMDPFLNVWRIGCIGAAHARLITLDQIMDTMRHDTDYHFML